MERSPARNIDSPSRLDQMRQIESRLEGTVGICGSSSMPRGGWRSLAASHRVNQVVHADDLQINIAPRSVDQVITANRREITVARIDHNIQFRIRQLQASRKRDRAAVRRMKRIKLHISRHTASAADPRDQRKRLKIDLGINQRA